MRVRRFLHLLLFLIAGLLMWKIEETWRRPLEESRSSAQPNSSEEKSMPSQQLPTLQVGKRYAEVITDKDLFVPSRSRALKEATPAVAVPPPSHLRLVGVLRTADREEAFLADSTQGGKVVRVRKGELIGSYRLVNVAPLQATLSMGQDGDEVSLPLLVLDSGTAGQAQRLLPSAMRAAQGRIAQLPGRSGAPSPRTGVPAATETAPSNETHAIRQNIQQLQQRLRQLRKHATDDGDEEGAEEDEAEEDETEDEE